MKTNNSTSVTIQKHPVYRVLPQDHPCVNNLVPVYIGRIHGNHKFSTAITDLYSLSKPHGKVTIENPVELGLNNSSVGQINKEENKPQLSARPIVFKDEYTLGELIDLNYTEIPFLVEKLIPAGALVLLGGQSDIGKSTLYTQLAISIVRGDQEFLGFKINPVHKRVLIISTEDWPPAVSFRILRQLNGKGIDQSIRNSIVVKFNYDDLESRIDAILQQTPVDLIIIDAFGDVFGDGINMSNNVRRYFNPYREINNKYYCSTLFVHHVGKSKKKQQADKDQLLGSVGIEGKMRNVLMLSIVNNQHQLRIVKGNHLGAGDKSKPVYLNFDEEKLTFSVATELAKPIENPFENKDNSTASGSSNSIKKKNRPGRKSDPKLKSEAIKMYLDKVPQVEIAKRVGRDKSTVCKWIKAYQASMGHDPSQTSEKVA